LEVIGKVMSSNEKKLDFTAKNIPEIARRMMEGTITDEELREAAENTSKIVGIPVTWMGPPPLTKEEFEALPPGYQRIIIENAQRKEKEWIEVFNPKSKPKQTKLGE